MSEVNGLMSSHVNIVNCWCQQNGLVTMPLCPGCHLPKDTLRPFVSVKFVRFMLFCSIKFPLIILNMMTMTIISNFFWTIRWSVIRWWTKEIFKIKFCKQNCVVNSYILCGERFVLKYCGSSLRLILWMDSSTSLPKK